MPETIRVLFDGWSLVRRPSSPAALHLLAILENLPGVVQPSVALPDAPPQWFPAVPILLKETTVDNQLVWEQRRLPRLARDQDAHLLHLFSTSAPLMGRTPTVISPCDFELASPSKQNQREQQGTVRMRLQHSLGRGGLARAQAIFWPDDLDAGNLPEVLMGMPPLVYSGFMLDQQPTIKKGSNGSARAWQELGQLDLPETYLLYHGPAGAPAINRLFDAWRWAAGSIGEYHPLLIVGFNAEEREQLMGMTKSFDFGETVRALPELSPQAVALLYQGTTALFHPAPEPAWGGPIRHALACCKPIVASQELQTSLLVGPAAYLAPADNGRALGAALITVVVEEGVADKLAQAARQRAAAWAGLGYSLALSEAYQKILENPKF